MIRVKKVWFWWTAWNTSQPLTDLESWSYVRSFSRSGAIEKCKRRIEPYV